MGGKAASDAVMVIVLTFGFSDGEHNVLDIAEISGLALAEIDEAADKLVAAQLLEPS